MASVGKSLRVSLLESVILYRHVEPEEPEGDAGADEHLQDGPASAADKVPVRVQTPWMKMPFERAGVAERAGQPASKGTVSY
eukprot:SAG22_NODE_9181_length_604_cov_2.758416_1_plen_82_part_00